MFSESEILILILELETQKINPGYLCGQFRRIYP